MQNNLSTERLQLSLVTPEDANFMLSLVNSPGWLQFIGDRRVHSTEDALDYIDRIMNTPDLYYWVVRLRDKNTPVGIVSFLKRGYLDHFDLGFAFLPDFNGLGYAFEAANGVQSLVAKLPEYNPILATTIPENVNSIKLLTRLGFHFQKEIEVGQEVLHVYSTQAA